MKTLSEYCKILESAKLPEDIFGKTATVEFIHSEFAKIAGVIHPDKWFNDKPSAAKATEAFRTLLQFRKIAETRIKDKIYGDVKIDTVDEIVITTRKNIYTIEKHISDGDVAKVYIAKTKTGTKVIVKISKFHTNNDLIENEIDTLKYLYETAPTKNLEVMEHIGPHPIDTFELNQDGMILKGAAFPVLNKMITLEDVIKSYPKGIDCRDAAWMINRLLAALMIPQQTNIVHGAVVPNNFMLDLPTHNGILIDWCFSVKTNTPLLAISTKYKSHYPEEVFKKSNVDIGLDIYMVAKIFLYLTGGDPATNKFNINTPRQIEHLFRACLLGPKHRTKDPYELHMEFKDVLKQTYGPAKHRAFKLV
jgi:serine/threonine protein kinase